jgi:hypothetical protein
VRPANGRAGDVEGEFRATGLRPTFLEALALNGSQVPDRAFHPGWAQ